ncbi:MULTISPECIES: DUF1330 domain-containing protein [unclassified Parafrankia]|uniref:DUF1330 domain-containing protein n=1 Tax=unclassified Parafrankia TaxID=2994368 RepID=UPI000DA474BE|nr:MULTISPECIES: DUF1330 domain-containing protein [unclassified Parafrankia]TCJ31784.1 DUF1330 domain-containing protein [Parafrankia sp. BMG5.11]CAI7974623.1 DUF1330 domain-containing protein [Frankia sp. Hr75.2]SQD93633.1 conserved hypothetical protein [Parafrankia sp. Ea1.12]
MPKGYVILTEAIKDPEGMAAYSRLSGPSVAAAGAKVLAVDEDVQLLEGEWHGNRTVVLEFPSADEARAWYESDDYQRAKPVRQAAADCNAVLLSGFEMPARRA